MNAYWAAVDAEECDDLEAKIITCVLSEGAINILFKGIHDGDLFEGRVSFDVNKENQNIEGLWIYHDNKRELGRFSTGQAESEESIYKSVVTGILKVKGNRVEFIGKWDDEVWDKENGCVYDFEIDARIA